MENFEWNEKFSVDIPSIDDQHKKLLDIINNLNQTLIKGETKESIALVLLSLTNYTVQHFRYEERLFDQFSYQHRQSHKKEHEEFIAKIEKVQNRLGSDQEVGPEMMTFLLNWLVNHIMKSDRLYTPLFLEKNIP